jgi:hypothetical protein
MQVLVRRSQYEGFWGTIYYTLDVLIEPSPDEAKLIARHGVGDIIVFDSQQRREYFERAQEHADAAGSHPIFQTSNNPEQVFIDTLTSIGSTLYSIGGSTYNLIAGSLEVRITINDLINGAHIESDQSGEILDAEHIIKKSITALKAHLSNLQTFDDRQELYEPE